MFGVPKYSAALEKIRQERNVEGLFNHNLVAIDNARKVARLRRARARRPTASMTCSTSCRRRRPPILSRLRRSVRRGATLPLGRGFSPARRTSC